MIFEIFFLPDVKSALFAKKQRFYLFDPGPEASFGLTEGIFVVGSCFGWAEIAGVIGRMGLLLRKITYETSDCILRAVCGIFNRPLRQ
jgi:hypothetical protein